MTTEVCKRPVAGRPKKRLAIVTASVAGILAVGSLISWQVGHVTWKGAGLSFSTDSGTYWDLAGNLLAGRGFVDSPGLGHAFTGYRNADYSPNIVRAPAYPASLAGARLVSSSRNAGFALNLVLYWSFVVAGLALFRAWRPRVGDMSTVGVAALLALNPASLLAARWGGVDLFTAVAFTALAFQLVFLVARLGAARNGIIVLNAALLSIWGLAAILSRPNAFIFVIPAMAISSVIAWRSPTAGTAVRRGVPVAATIVVLGFTAWCLRGFEVSGTLSPAPSSGHHGWFNYVVDAKPAKPPQPIDREATMARLIASGENPSEAEAELSKRLQSATVESIRNNPGAATRKLATSYARSFLDAYLRFSTVLSSRLFGVPIDSSNSEIDRSRLSSQSPLAVPFYWASRSVNVAWGLLLAIALIAYPFVARRISGDRDAMRVRLAIWGSALLFWLATFAIIDQGERLRLPLDAVLVCLLIDLAAVVWVSTGTRQEAYHAAAAKDRPGATNPESG